MNACVTCKHFTDSHYSKTYKTPICTVHGGDDCAFMRQYVCGLDGNLYQPDGTLQKEVKQDEQQFNN